MGLIGFHPEGEDSEILKSKVIEGNNSQISNLKEYPETRTEKLILELFPEYDFVLLAFISKLRIWFSTGIFSLICFNRLRSRTPRIIYIQDPFESWWLPRRYLFIVDENRKWGLVNNSYKILIEPQYDSMKWFKEDKLIEVLKDGKRYIVDINNNICV